MSGYNPLPDLLFRDGGPIPVGPTAVVAAVFLNRMARRRCAVNYKNRMIELAPLQACVSERDIAHCAGLSRKVVRTCVKNLQKTGFLGPVEGPAKVGDLRMYNINLALFGIEKGTTKGPTEGPAGAQCGPTDVNVKRINENDSPSGTASAVSDGHSSTIRLDAEYYRLGRMVLGKNSGGLLTKLKKQVGVGEALNLICKAQDKDRPDEWIGAVISRGSAIHGGHEKFGGAKRVARGQAW